MPTAWLLIDTGLRRGGSWCNSGNDGLIRGPRTHEQQHPFSGKSLRQRIPSRCGHSSRRLAGNRGSKGTLLTYWNNFVPASEPWLAENGQPTLRQSRLNGPGSQPTLSRRGIEPVRPNPRHFRIVPPRNSSYSTTSPVSGREAVPDGRCSFRDTANRKSSPIRWRTSRKRNGCLPRPRSSSPQARLARRPLPATAAPAAGLGRRRALRPRSAPTTSIGCVEAIKVRHTDSSGGIRTNGARWRSIRRKVPDEPSQNNSLNRSRGGQSPRPNEGLFAPVARTASLAEGDSSCSSFGTRGFPCRDD